MLPAALDDVARTSDDEAVRARFDAVCLTALRFISIPFIVIGFAHLIEARGAALRLAGLVSFVLALVAAIASRKRASNAVALALRRHPRPMAMSFLLLQAALLIGYHASSGQRTATVFATVLPFLALGFRLLPAEHVLFHATMTAIPALSGFLFPVQRAAERLVMGPLLVNAAVLMLSLFVSRRMRRNTAEEWTERRASARVQIRMRDELRYARELQLSMLPERDPQLDWADVAGTSLPAAEVGGDYYDYFVEEERLVLVSGDVAGHGMASGLVLAALRGGFMLLRESLRDPAAVLHRLHDLVVHTTRRRMLVTVSVVLLDRNLRQATIASAGHPPVIVRRADGSASTIDLYAPPLGVRLPVNIPQRQIPFASGDLFVLHSDGLYETRDGADESFGLDRLVERVRELGGGSAAALRDALMSEIDSFRGAQKQHDDMTLVVCKITG